MKNSEITITLDEAFASIRKAVESGGNVRISWEAPVTSQVYQPDPNLISRGPTGEIIWKFSIHLPLPKLPNNEGH